ncbi:hypothetical protein [Actinokineospora iranica]|uniref:hypothetical protein n=1 Tax=Actinokineospora iranica TaxID=1271860 RepID=UPI000B86B338|nr:hypothetical protein [Actinokineospora iranica]
MTGPTERLPTGDDVTTVEFPRITAADVADTAPRTGSGAGFLRELSGALAVGLCVLALAVLALQIIATTKGMPGPGIAVLIGHVTAAVAAVVAQRFADRKTGPEAALAVLLVAIATGAAIWFFWWA